MIRRASALISTPYSEISKLVGGRFWIWLDGLGLGTGVAGGVVCAQAGPAVNISAQRISIGFFINNLVLICTPKLKRILEMPGTVRTDASIAQFCRSYIVTGAVFARSSSIKIWDSGESGKVAFKGWRDRPARNHTDTATRLTCLIVAVLVQLPFT
jgi:hypothetical protein